MTKRSLMKSKRKLKKYLETNDNENTTTQNLWDAAKAVLRGKFRETNVNIKKKIISNKQLNFIPQGTKT